MSSKNYYVNGNTVRELDTPVRHNQRTRKEIEEARRRKISLKSILCKYTFFAAKASVPGG